MILPDGTDTEHLDPGIRDVVAWLQLEGFRTSDSGDGVSKFQPGSRWYDPEGDQYIPYPHVIMVCDPEEMIHEARRLHKLLKMFHIIPVRTDEELNDEENMNMMVQCNYNPVERDPDGNEFGIIMLLGVNDDSLSRAVVGDES